MENGRYELARLTLNTLINTYDTSEYLAKAKLAIADSWYREGGVHGLAQAEAEYKDFKLFYPTMPEAAESQKRSARSTSRQMEKPDRDPNKALRAEQECKQLMLQFPNSKFVPETEQMLREIQEDLARERDARRRISTSEGRLRPRRPIGWAAWWISIRCTAGRMRRCGRRPIRTAICGPSRRPKAGRGLAETRARISAEPLRRARPRRSSQELEMEVPGGRSGGRGAHEV